jgi:hypothetical protein
MHSSAGRNFLAPKNLDESPAMQLASETGILDLLEIRGEDLLKRGFASTRNKSKVYDLLNTS